MGSRDKPGLFPSALTSHHRARALSSGSLLPVVSTGPSLVVSVLVSFATVRECSPTTVQGVDQGTRPAPNIAGHATVALKSGRSAVRPRPWPPVLRRADEAVTSGNAGRRF